MIQQIIDIQKGQTTALKELMEICTILKDRVEVLEEEIKNK